MIERIKLLLAVPFYSVYEGEPPDPDPAPPEPDPANTPPPKKVVFTPEQQAVLNRQLADERRKLEKKNNELIQQLQAQQNRADTTAAERQQLEERIDQLRSEFATEKELNERNTTKKIKELEVKVQDAAARAETWQKRYELNKKSVDLTNAAVSEKAFNAEQVVTILEPMTRLVEVVGEDGKPIGEYETRVKLPTKDKEGKAVILDLTPTEAVKQLKEMPEKYGNLFISGAAGGLGGGNLGGRQGGKKELHQLSTEEYMAQRQAERKAKRGGK